MVGASFRPSDPRHSATPGLHWLRVDPRPRALFLSLSLRAVKEGLSEEVFSQSRKLPSCHYCLRHWSFTSSLFEVIPFSVISDTWGACISGTVWVPPVCLIDPNIFFHLDSQTRSSWYQIFKYVIFKYLIPVIPFETVISPSEITYLKIICHYRNIAHKTKFIVITQIVSNFSHWENSRI